MEVFSEDPYLTTILGGAYTFSLQVDSHTWLNLSKRSTATICSQRLPNTSPFTPDPTARASPSSRTRRSLFLLVSFTQTRSLRILPSPIRNTNTMLKRTWNHASLFVFLFHRGYLEVFDRKSRTKANPTSQTTFYYKLCFEIAGIDPISTWWPIIPRFYSY